MVFTRNENKCRLCLMKSDPDGSSPVSIFDDDRLDRPLPDLISDCLQLTVTSDEPLPRVICERCFAKLCAFSNFKRQCLGNDRLLRESLSERTSFKEESDEGDLDRPSPKREASEEECVTPKGEPPDDFFPIRSPAKKKFVCEICNKSYTRKFYLGKHVCNPAKSKTGEPRKFSDDICKKSSTRKLHLDRHISNRDKSKIRQTLRNDCSLERETPSDVSRSKKIFTCDICQKSFTRKFYLGRHISNHDKRRRVSKEKFISHISEARCAPKKVTCHANVPCERCGRLFPSRGAARWHVRAVHERNFVSQCAICGKKFANKGNLAIHMNLHTRHTVYECKLCAKRLATKKSYDTHVRNHSGARPFACRFCDDAFRCPQTLKVHERRRHTGEAPYKCPLCDARTSHLTPLKDHFARHHRGVRFYEAYKKYDRREVADY